MSCIFDPHIPIRNNPPVCTNMQSIDKTIFYPESSICTLYISDLNDRHLQISFIQNDSPDTLPCFCSFQCINESFDLKYIYLWLNTNLLKTYTGSLFIKDSHQEQTMIPYRIRSIFLEHFDSFPLSAKNWTYYSNPEAKHLRFDYIDRKLQFVFDSTSQELSTGIRSNFKIGGDFTASIELKLRDEMKDGFTVNFFISNSADTGKWDGDIAGISISGLQSSMKLDCKSIELQNYSRVEKMTSGELKLSRKGSLLNYYFNDGTTSSDSQPVITHSYLPDDSVYIHLKMTVSDLSKVRHCSWNNFAVTEGIFSF